MQVRSKYRWWMSAPATGAAMGAQPPAAAFSIFVHSCLYISGQVEQYLDGLGTLSLVTPASVLSNYAGMAWTSRYQIDIRYAICQPSAPHQNLSIPSLGNCTSVLLSIMLPKKHLRRCESVNVDGCASFEAGPKRVVKRKDKCTH